MRVAVVGATGLVGSTMLQILEERNFPLTELIPVASARSVGGTISYRGEENKVGTPAEAIKSRTALGLVSAGGSVSLELAPLFADAGCRVVDNSSAWRMHPDKKLI